MIKINDNKIIIIHKKQNLKKTEKICKRWEKKKRVETKIKSKQNLFRWPVTAIENIKCSSVTACFQHQAICYIA